MHACMHSNVSLSSHVFKRESLESMGYCTPYDDATFSTAVAGSISKSANA